MLTLDRKHQPLALRDSRRFEPPFLAGLLFAALAIVPITAPGSFTGMRVLGLGLLLTASTTLVLVGLPRSRCRPLLMRGASKASSRERAVRLELDGSPLPPVYRAVLVLSDGSRHTVLERGEPAGVLEDATLLADELAVPIAPGWGLDEATLETLTRPQHPTPRWGDDAPFTFDSPPFAGQRNAAWTTLWASAFVLVATILMSESARARVTPGALSLTLPGISAALVLVAAIWLLGLRGELKLGPTGVTRQELWFSVELGRPETRELAVAAAAFVAPPGGTVGHLVLSNGTSLSAFPLRGGTAQTARLRTALAAQRTHRAAE